MQNKVAASKQGCLFTSLLNEEKTAVLEKLDQLERAFHNLKYEGKLFSFDHLQKAEAAVGFLKKKYTAHIKLDERVIFPFSEKHIPRLRPFLIYLKEERCQFQKGLKVLEKTLLELRKDNKNASRHDVIERLKEKGAYLICMIRSYIQFEEESVYQALFQELHQEEQASLQNAIGKFLKKE